MTNAQDGGPGSRLDRVSIEFTDSGSGMPEEVRRRAGEPLFSHGKRQGTGLGLAMVQKIVADHRGTVEIDSAPGAGTTVRLLLPLGTGFDPKPGPQPAGG